MSGKAVAFFLLVVALQVGGCESRQAAEAKRRIQPFYDRETGKLTLLKYDSNGDGKPDTFSYMDGAQTIRIEIDEDGDGTIDRWEYYGRDQKLEKVGFSRAHDGKVDAWAYANADGSTARIEMSMARNGRIDRTEYYERGVLVRAEEDTDGDGRIDKWEEYDSARLVLVAFDTRHRGVPDRRLVYAPDGDVRVEIDPAGEGHFTVSRERPGLPIPRP
jgi:EF hand